MLEGIIGNPVAYLFLSLLGLLGVYHFGKKLRGIRAAERIVACQFEPISKKVIDEGFDFFEGEQLNRYAVIVRRIREQYGHDGFKVGHMAWILQLLDDSNIDVNSIDIPDFEANRQ
jgi:hypothetical protein